MYSVPDCSMQFVSLKFRMTFGVASFSSAVNCEMCVSRANSCTKYVIRCDLLKSEIENRSLESEQLHICSFERLCI